MYIQVDTIVFCQKIFPFYLVLAQTLQTTVHCGRDTIKLKNTIWRETEIVNQQHTEINKQKKNNPNELCAHPNGYLKFVK